ncbi:MAG: hypothetical protein LBR80_11455, partial [Deltaproteobacteria bacterium]|nr:hypothetical protein [Deltaproteobacteria bacterium]
QPAEPEHGQEEAQPAEPEHGQEEAQPAEPEHGQEYAPAPGPEPAPGTGTEIEPEAGVEAGPEASTEEALWLGDLERSRKDLGDLEAFLAAEARRHGEPRSYGGNTSALLRGLENCLIDSGNLEALYWYSRANPDGEVGAWLAETLYLGTNCHYLRLDSGRRLSELFAEGVNRVRWLDPRQLRLLAAALVRPALTIRDHNLVKLLEVLAAERSLRPKLGILLAEMATRNEHGEIVLGEQTISRAAAEAKRAELVRSLEEDTARWLDSAPRQKIIYALASDIHHLLVAPNGELHGLVTGARAARGEADLDALALEVRSWKDPAFVQKKILEIQKLVNVSTTKKIVARAKGKLHEKIRAAALLAGRWVDHNRERSRSRFDESVRTHLLEVLRGLSELASPPQLPPVLAPEDASARLLQRMLDELAGGYSAYLSEGGPPKAAPAGLPELETRLRLWLLKARGPSVEADGEDLPFAEFVAALLNGKGTPDDCLEQLRGEGFGTHLVATAVALEPELADVRDPGTGRRLGELLKDACGAFAGRLASRLSDAADRVEEQYVRGGIRRPDRDAFAGELEAVSRVLEEMPELRGRDAQDGLWTRPDLLGSAAAASSRIRRVRAGLDRLAGEASREAEARLAELKSTADVPADAEALVRDMILNGEYSAAADQLARTARAMESGARAPAAPSRGGDSYAEGFYAALDGTHEAGLAEDRTRGKASGGDGLAAVWNAMSSHSAAVNAPRRVFSGRLAELLRNLGFSFDASVRLFDDLKSDGRPFYWSRLVLNGATISSVLPRWGSKAEGRHVIVMGWGDVTAGDIVQRVSSYGDDPAGSGFVFLFGRLNRAGRELLGREFRRSRLCPVVVDSNLADWLASSGLDQLERTRAMLECGAAGGWYNPYTPDAAVVPREMFYGRENDIDELWNQYGPCLLYGGRQLGKSAMLMQLLRSRHRPEEGAHVLYRSARHASTLDEIVSSMLRAAGLGSVEAASGPLSAHIQMLLTAPDAEKAPGGEQDADGTPGGGEGTEGVPGAPCRRILLLIDESDRLLDAERACGFERIEAYRDLMQSTDRKFKMVLAGTHSVQRFHHYPNNPLKHFGAPLCIGPLDPADAYSLIERPMKALGISFESPSLCFKALTLTNYHPSLLQLVCHALVRHVQRNGEDAAWSPPFRISRELLDGVFRNPDLQSQMRARYEWTVDLDPRYRVIAYVIAFMEEDSGAGTGREGFPVTEILDNLRYFWPKGFSGVDFDQVECLMVEMEGLGLLKRVRDRFALKNESVLKLLQADGDVSTELEKFESMDYAPQSGPEGMRRALPGEASGAPEAVAPPSPLAYSVENSLRAWETSCALVVGSEALGLLRVVAALSTVLSDDLGTASPGDAVTVVPDSLDARGQAAAISAAFAAVAHPASDRAMAVVVCGDPEKFWAVFRAAERFVARKRGLGRFFKVIGVADARGYMEGLAGGGLGSGSETVHFLERWNVNAIAGFLDATGLAADRSEGILRSTGGWDSLVLREFVLLRGREGGTEGTGDDRPPAADAGFAATAGFRDPPPLFRAIDDFLVSFWDSPFTEEDFPKLLEMHVRDSGNAYPGLAPSAGEIADAFYLLQRMTLVVQPPPDQLPQGAASAEARYWIDRHYLASLRPMPDLGNAPGEPVPDGAGKQESIFSADKAECPDGAGREESPEEPELGEPDRRTGASP